MACPISWRRISAVFMKSAPGKLYAKTHKQPFHEWQTWTLIDAGWRWDFHASGNLLVNSERTFELHSQQIEAFKSCTISVFLLFTEDCSLILYWHITIIWLWVSLWVILAKYKQQFVFLSIQFVEFRTNKTAFEFYFSFSIRRKILLVTFGNLWWWHTIN